MLLPDGERLSAHGAAGDRPHGVLQLHRWGALRRLLLGGSIGLAEAYIDGDWDSPDLPALLEIGVHNEPAFGAAVEGLAPIRLLHRLRHLLRRNTRRGSRANITRHYDLGNDFYAAWLDQDMTYSSALFTSSEQPLQDAQQAKYRRLAEQLDLRPGLHLLEIGCGWGTFAVQVAARYGCRVTALTLSAAQAAFTRERVRAVGLDDQVEVRIEDYRDVRGQYDRIASIEMFEAVGEAYWPAFFAAVRDRLRAGGVAGLQVITIDDERFESYRRNADFIQTHIFPGGMLPSPSVLAGRIADAGLRVVDRFRFGESYAVTLARWQERFQSAWPQIGRLGYDEHFKRTWEYYLAYCEAGFRAGSIDVWQLRIDKPVAAAR